MLDATHHNKRLITAIKSPTQDAHMTIIKLEERNIEGKILDTLNGEFSESDWKVLSNFISHLDRAMECSLIQRGIPGITNMKWDSEGMKFNAKSYSNPELHELLHVLRPLILHKEPASFAAVRATLGRCFKNKRLSARLKNLQHQFDHGELAAYMQITIGDQPLFDNSLLNTWLNGTQYHTEEEKADAWHEIENDLSTENARAIIINHLKGKVSALLELGHIVKTITNKKT